jgi:asparagine synthetase B (glutamine-hydrolysing)
MYGCLERAVRRGIGSESTVNIALSGGFDSGTIAYLIRQSGCRLAAYTLGTDWGDEYREARETADHLGIPLTPVHVSEEEIAGEIPSVIRFFHFINPENIEIALVAHCLYKRLQEERPSPRVFLTGYGSDLLNAGGVIRCDSSEQLHAGIRRELERTQLSNEFSNLAALHHGVRAHHPFWESEVIACALRVPAADKLRDGQDKLYAREMMAGRLPDSTVWRRKLGAHRGSGLSQGLRDVLAGKRGAGTGASIGYQRMIEAVHQDIFCRGNYAGG